MYKVRVYYWNPNGTNDIEIVNKNGDAIDCLPEALFGFRVVGDEQVVSIPEALKFIAVSPVTSESEAEELLLKYSKKAA